MLLQVQTTPHQQPLATLHFELALCSLYSTPTGGTLGPITTASEHVLDGGNLTQDLMAPRLLSLGFKLDCMSLPLQLPTSVFPSGNAVRCASPVLNARQSPSPACWHVLASEEGRPGS
jgi:hypothetical protein